MTDNSCYWHHDASSGERFLCMDGENVVCQRCCFEHCPRETPDWFAKCAAAGHPTWPWVSEGRTAACKLVCLESYWDDELFDTLSVRGFLEALRPLLQPPLQIAHRFIETAKGLAYYTKKPNGLLWNQPETFDAPVYYLAFHGAPGSVSSLLDIVGPDRLCNAFRDFGVADCLVYFGSCSVFRGRAGQRFARDFLDASGARAVLGYTEDVDWMVSMIADLLFLQRFYAARDPWPDLARIHASVTTDFRPAQKAGLSLFLGGSPAG